MSDELDRAIEHRLSGGAHYHHRGCIHNLPPEDQIAMRGWTVQKWLTIIGPLPEQIAPDQCPCCGALLDYDPHLQVAFCHQCELTRPDR